MRPRVWTPLLSVLLLLGGCDFFQELQSAEGAGDTDGSGDTDGFGDTEGADTEGAACGLAEDRCETQDLLHSCNFETGELVSANCGALCGENLNFSCINMGTGQHACWCVTPGEVKIDTCPQLEACLNGCTDGPDGYCAANCFSRTTASTVRLLGSLVACAEKACHEYCTEDAGACAECLLTARSGLWGDCGVERSVCDSDPSDEPSWP